MRADLCLLQRGRSSFTDRVFPGLGRFCRQVILGVALIITLPVVSAATACSGQHNVHLTRPVDIDAALQAELARLPTLRVLSVDAPPLVYYDPDRKGYDGIAVDILCFIAAQLNIRFALVSDPSEATSEKLQQVQKGEADVFVPLSYSLERAQRGLFTEPFANSYYAVVGRHGSAVIRNIDDLRNYRIGYIEGVVLEPTLRALMPPEQLIAFKGGTADVLLEAVRKRRIDLALINKAVFLEMRYHKEFFDLESLYTLYEYPRAYRFYFSPAPQHVPLVTTINRYLAALDLSASAALHQDGERTLLERYVRQRSQRGLLFITSVAGLALLGIMAFALRRHRRLARLLHDQNRHIEQQRRALQEANLKLEELTRTDTLTNLPNRRFFDAKLNEAYLQYLRGGAPLSVLVIDVDHFKNVNDHYGHLTGDSYLRSVARALERSIHGKMSCLARYGGEEFICLLEGEIPASAAAVAELIRSEVEKLRLPNVTAKAPCLTVSIGVATLLRGDPGALALVECADNQLYEAKAGGRNRVCGAVLGPIQGA